jgi:hypothetical protein
LEEPLFTIERTGGQERIVITNLKTNRYFSGYVPVEKHPLLQVAFATANSAYRKEALDEIKGFDVRCGTGEDIDLSIRMSRSGWKLYFQPGAVVRHKHRHTLSQLLKQWFRYGLHHPYLYKKHHKKRLEVFVYKRRKEEEKPYGVTHVFGVPFPFHAAFHLSDFYYMHALLGLFLASLFPFGPTPLSGLSLLGAGYFGARHCLADFDLDDPKKSMTYVLLRYLLNVTYIAGGFVGGIKNGVLFLDLPREQNPSSGRTSIVCSDMGPGDRGESIWLRQFAETNGIQLRGICYDVGTRYARSLKSMLPGCQKPPRTPIEMDRDFKVIREELSCNAIRIFGDSRESLLSSTDLALRRGFSVLVSPRFINFTIRQAAVGTARLAKDLDELRKKWGPGRIILLVANEVSLDLKGVVPGAGVEDRREHRITSKFQLNKSLKEIAIAARSNFDGLISYGASPSDAVNWRMFDVICMNLYLNERNRNSYTDIIGEIADSDKPVLITEFGFVTNDKALALGELGYRAVDWRTKRVEKDVRRDEKAQAELMAENFFALGKTNIKGSFVYSFAEWNKTHRSRLSADLDAASFGVMKVAEDKRLISKPAASVIGRFYKTWESELKERFQP